MNLSSQFKLLNFNQLRPLTYLYRIQFGKRMRIQGKLIPTWIKNTVFFRPRRKTG